MGAFIPNTDQPVMLAGVDDAVEVELSDGDGVFVVGRDGKARGLGLAAGHELLPGAETPVAQLRVRKAACAASVSGPMRCSASFAPSVTMPADVVDLDIESHFPAAFDWPSHGCAVTRSGTVHCWGIHTSGELGPTPIPQSDAGQSEWALVDVPGIDDANAVAVGEGFSCVSRRSGKVTCWRGQRGYSSVIPSGEEAGTLWDVPGIDDAIHVSAGANNLYGWTVCVTLRNGRARCWGGRPRATQPDKFGTPGELQGIAHAVRTYVGAYEICSLLSDGGVACTGRTLRYVPGQVSLPSPARSLFAKGPTTVAVLQDGSVVAWGRHPETQASEASPKPLFGFRNPRAVSPTVRGDLCLIDERAQLVVVHDGVATRPGLSDMVDVSCDHSLRDESPSRFGCAVHMSGEVSCWGQNHAGEVGDPNLSRNSNDETALPPRRVGGVKNVAHVRTTTNAVCVVHQDGTVTCWGRGSQFDESVFIYPWTPQLARPRKLASLKGVVDVSFVNGHACAIFKDASVKCSWQRKLTEAAKDVREIVANWVLSRSGAVEYIGVRGAPGNGYYRMDPPDSIPRGLDQIAQLAAGEAEIGRGMHLCARTHSGEVRCFGDGAQGQIGDAAFVGKARLVLAAVPPEHSPVPMP